MLARLSRLCVLAGLVQAVAGDGEVRAAGDRALVGSG